MALSGKLLIVLLILIILGPLFIGLLLLGGLAALGIAFMTLGTFTIIGIVLVLASLAFLFLVKKHNIGLVLLLIGIILIGIEYIV